MIVAQGGSIGGWSLYAVGGRLRYCYNLLGVQRFYVGSDREIPAGTRQVRMEFDYDGPGLGKGGMVSLFVDGEPAGQGAVAATAAMIFSADDTATSARRVAASSRTTTPLRTPSPARSTGSSSTSATLPRTPTTGSIRTSCCASRWRGSDG